MSATTIRIEDKSVSAAGLTLRYLESGSGHPVIFLHGGSLGSSADAFLRNMPAFAKAICIASMGLRTTRRCACCCTFSG